MKVKPVVAAKSALTEALGIPREILLDEPRLTLEGKARLTVENHRGISEYTLECVRIRTIGGEVRVTGCGLVIDEFSQTRAVVCGIICALSYE